MSVFLPVTEMKRSRRSDESMTLSARSIRQKPTKETPLYDTGSIDSKDVQRRYPSCFTKLMTNLKQKIFTDYKNPFLPPAEVETLDKNSMMCLRAMRNIKLVVFEERGVRLSQACDVMSLYPPSFDEQVKQKKELYGDLNRNTTEEERDDFELKEFTGSRHSSSIELTDTWWSPSEKKLGGYGDISATTNVSDMCPIADVDIESFEEQARENMIDNPTDLNAILLSAVFHGMIDYDKSKNTDADSNIMNYENDYSLSGPYGRDTYEHDVIKYKKKLNYKLKPKEKWDFSEYERIVNENFRSAAFILEHIREIHWYYHPWVTVEEIQRHRRYGSYMGEDSIREDSEDDY